MKLRCVIVDDEPLASEGLMKYIEVIDYLELVAIAENPLELNKILENERIDLIFLDIQMPHMTGLDFLKIKTNLPMVIITTAYPNYALEGFQFDAVDYLLKPITFNRFFKATNKAKELHYLKNQKTENQPQNSEPDYLFIKCESKYEKILIDEILFVQALQNYVIIFTTRGKYMTLLPLKTVEEYLDPTRFLRVHKSYLVAIAKIGSIENNDITIQSHLIPISRTMREQVIEIVVKSKLLTR
ncbi:LytTR family DNA-binding domain-containing protein [Emticicia sp. BO119]|uniref:LytR/AlgR family response regulator transcription factor n=1 Tax=Emticicia sp. BO119 TaxID=2757768 RepID=UPI0015F063B2|nr:LytTR family DNA-binding domain-containing protein [Emticicia sp. BO119]MBA4849377.1 response regulator transcription factor [Emticicia sp. BO119]